MLDSTDSGDDRRAMRRARRWRRRARIAGPFLVVPAMLGLLVLSVDLIEYQPSPASDRASATARPGRVAAPATSAFPDGSTRPLPHAPESALSVSVVGDPLPSGRAPTAAPAAGPGLPAWMTDTSEAAPAR